MQNQKIKNKQAEKAVRWKQEIGVNPTTARLRAKQLLDPDFDGDLADPNQSAEDFCSEHHKRLDDLTQSFDKVANSTNFQANAKQRKVLDLLETLVIQ